MFIWKEKQLINRFLYKLYFHSVTIIKSIALIYVETTVLGQLPSGRFPPQKIAPDFNPNPNPNLKPGGEIVGEQSSGGQFSGHQRSHVNF